MEAEEEGDEEGVGAPAGKPPDTLSSEDKDAVGCSVEGEEGCSVEGEEDCFAEGAEGCFAEGTEGCEEAAGDADSERGSAKGRR